MKTSKNYWLMKSEPETWSWEQQKKKKVEHWDGVRNYQAANYMKQMKKGDECLFYSSVSEKAIKGIMTVVKEYYPDHTDKKNIFPVVEKRNLGQLEISQSTRVAVLDERGKMEIKNWKKHNIHR